MKAYRMILCLAIGFLLAGLPLHAQNLKCFQQDYGVPLQAGVSARNSLGNYYQADTIYPPALDGLEKYSMLIFESNSRELPAYTNNTEFIKDVKTYMENGGGLFLVGYALKLLKKLGVTDAEPIRELSMWGNTLSNYRYSVTHRHELFNHGFEKLKNHQLFAGMNEIEYAKNTFFLGAGCISIVEQCVYDTADIANENILGTWYYNIQTPKRDVFKEINRYRDYVLLSEWKLGKGRVIAYGANLFLEDEIWNNPNLDNLHMFLDNIKEYLSKNEHGKVACLIPEPAKLYVDNLSPIPGLPQKQVHSYEKAFPGLPYIAHWGWHAPISYQRAKKEHVGLNYFKERMIEEPRKWGANLIEFYPPDMDDGFPFELEGFNGRDTMEYWGGNYDPLWNADTARALFKIAHENDMAVQLFWHHTPVNYIPGKFPIIQDRIYKNKDNSELPLTEQKIFGQFLELQASKMQNPLLYGREVSYDGIGQEQWGNDRLGQYTKNIWKYSPASYRYSLDQRPANQPNFNLSLQCAIGRPTGTNACGFADYWLYVLHPPYALSYQADCRLTKIDSREWGVWANYGGGSYPDWLLAEANSFVIDRLSLDNAIWWLGEPEATLPEEYRKYVYGVSMDPIKTAFANSFRSRGTDGYRMNQYNHNKWINEQFPANVNYPLQAHFIQNNYIQMIRMPNEQKGILYYDPLKLARYPTAHIRNAEAMLLSESFIKAEKLSKQEAEIKPEVILSIGKIDNSDDEFVQSGQYEPRHYCSFTQEEFPARIGHNNDPESPTHIISRFNAETGLYKLHLYALKPTNLKKVDLYGGGSQIGFTGEVEIFMDNQSIGFYFITPEDSSYHCMIPFSISQPGKHELKMTGIRIVDPQTKNDFQGTVADPQSEENFRGTILQFDALSIERISDNATSFKVVGGPGYFAQLRENIAIGKNSTETRTYTIHNDQPALRVDYSYKCKETGSWIYSIHLPGYQLKTYDNKTQYARLEGSKGKPGVHFYIEGIEPQKVEYISDELVFEIEKKETGSFSTYFIFDDGAYSAYDAAELKKGFFSGIKAISIAEKETKTVEYPYRFSVTQIIETGQPGPYYVSEANAIGERYWYYRGTQQYEGKSFLKIYQQPDEKVKIQKNEYINSIVKPGYGCQYNLLIKDLVEQNRCEVEVVRTGAFVAAPRVDFKEPFGSVKLNGKPWYYFDGKTVFLPNREGTYSIEIFQTKNEPAPTIGGSWASISRTHWDTESKCLTIEANHPYWWKSGLPGNISYTAIILTNGLKPVKAEGSISLIEDSEYQCSPEVLQQMKERGIIVEIRPGEGKVYFE